MSPHVLALHGGAGVKPGRDYAEAVNHLAEVARLGEVRLRAGAPALDVVEEAVASLERSGLYVAGRGARPDGAGVAELDASIMDGAGARAGAVAAVRNIVSPIAAARRVMERTPHVLLVAEGAADFARGEGLAFVEDGRSYYREPPGVRAEDGGGHGTVGAVALDLHGHLAAATSTGGTFGKMPGRVGDSPLIGAGCWADGDVAVSCTGLGEAFVRANAAADVSARVRYLGQDLDSAASRVLETVAARGGDGGIIVVNKLGQCVFAFNSGGMKRARAGSAYALEAGAIELTAFGAS